MILPTVIISIIGTSPYQPVHAEFPDETSALQALGILAELARSRAKSAVEERLIEQFGAQALRIIDGTL